MENQIGDLAMKSEDFELVALQLQKASSQVLRQSKPDSRGEVSMSCKFETERPESEEEKLKFDLALNIILTINCIEEETKESVCQVETQHHAAFKVREGYEIDTSDKALSVELGKFVYPAAREHVADLLSKMGFVGINLPWHISPSRL